MKKRIEKHEAIFIQKSQPESGRKSVPFSFDGVSSDVYASTQLLTSIHCVSIFTFLHVCHLHLHLQLHLFLLFMRHIFHPPLPKLGDELGPNSSPSSLFFFVKPGFFSQSLDSYLYLCLSIFVLHVFLDLCPFCVSRFVSVLCL